MAQVLHIRKSEEPRHQIRNGYMEWYAQHELEKAEQARVEANIAVIQNKLPPDEWFADNPKAKKSLIDRLFPWIVILGILALIALGNLGADWVVTIGK